MPSFYKAGSVTTQAGSPNVIGAGTAFVDNNVRPGMVFLDNENKAYEIASVVSNTQLTLARNYGGAGGGGQVYAIQPTQQFAADLADAFNGFKTVYQAYIDTVLQGLFQPGTVAAPGVRSTVDADTGLRWLGNNALALVSGGTDRINVLPSGNIDIGTPIDQARLNVFTTTTTLGGYEVLGLFAGPTNPLCRIVHGGSGGSASIGYTPAQGLSFYVAGNPGAVGTRAGGFDAAGNMLVGTATDTFQAHTIAKLGGVGTGICSFRGSTTNKTSLLALVVDAEGYNTSLAAVWAGYSSATGRSINAGGTINASGADYAEYMTRADGCGEIAKGDICGVDRDGNLTKSWVAAVSFVVKSTDPSYVGGDTWFTDPRPEGPGDKPLPPPDLPPPPPAPQPAGAMPDPDDIEAMTEWALATQAGTLYAQFMAQRALAETDREEAVRRYGEDLATWEKADGKYRAALAKWEADMEAARQRVDRIAFCGQVPANIEGEANVGDYIVAAANGGGIKGVAVAAAEISFEQYRMRIGKVYAIRDGRPWIDVQHG